MLFFENAKDTFQKMKQIRNKKLDFSEKINKNNKENFDRNLFKAFRSERKEKSFSPLLKYEKSVSYFTTRQNFNFQEFAEKINYLIEYIENNPKTKNVNQKLENLNLLI